MTDIFAFSYLHKCIFGNYSFSFTAKFLCKVLIIGDCTHAQHTRVPNTFVARYNPPTTFATQGPMSFKLWCRNLTCPRSSPTITCSYDDLPMFRHAMVSVVYWHRPACDEKCLLSVYISGSQSGVYCPSGDREGISEKREVILNYYQNHLSPVKSYGFCV